MYVPLKLVQAVLEMLQFTVTLWPLGMSGWITFLQVPRTLESALLVSVKVTVEGADAPVVPPLFENTADRMHGSAHLELLIEVRTYWGGQVEWSSRLNTLVGATMAKSLL